MEIDIFSEAFCQDRYRYYSMLESNGPVSFSKVSDCWLISGYKEAAEVLADYRRFSSSPMQGEDPVLLGADMPEHKHNRNAVNENHSLFSKNEKMQSLEDHFTAVARKLIRRIGPLHSFELMKDYIIPYTASGGLLISGLKDLYPNYDILHAYNKPDAVIKDLVSLYNNWSLIDSSLGEIVKKDSEYFTAGMIYRDERISQRYTHDQFSKFVKTLLIAGSETPSGLLSASMYTLLKEPGILKELQNDPEKLIPLFMDEVLRYYSPGQVTFRMCTEDAAVAGQIIKAGQRVAILVGAANRDKSVFSDPVKFDLFRNNSNILSFGRGIHYCIGSHLGKLSAGIAIREFMTKLPLLRISDKSTKYFNSPQVFRLEAINVERIKRNFFSSLWQSR